MRSKAERRRDAIRRRRLAGRRLNATELSLCGMPVPAAAPDSSPPRKRAPLLVLVAARAHKEPAAAPRPVRNRAASSSFSDPHGSAFDPRTRGFYVDIRMRVHLADGSSQSLVLDYPWYYASESANPWSDENLRDPNFPTRFQPPPKANSKASRS